MTGTIDLSPGKYRITMTGGGGSPGLCWRPGSKFERSASCGSGGGIYGILTLEETSSMTYCVGAINTATTFGPLSCGPGNAPTSSTSSSVSGGAISGTSFLEEYTVKATR